MGPNNFSVSVSTGPNSLAESVSIVDGSDFMGPNNFDDSNGIDVFLDEESGTPFFEPIQVQRSEALVCARSIALPGWKLCRRHEFY
jgi:hypothetical protein